MARVDSYGPQRTSTGSIPEDGVRAAISIPNNAQVALNAFQPVIDYAKANNDNRNKLEAMSKLSDLELQGKKRLQELQQTDLGDKNIGEVYAKEMDDAFKSVASTIPMSNSDFFNEKAIGLKRQMSDQALNAQAAQNANRVKNSAGTFLDNMQKMAITDPASVDMYANQVREFAANLPMSSEGKDQFIKASIDSVYDSHAGSLKNTDPEAFWQLFSSGFYNDKVSPDTLAKIQGYRGQAEQVELSRIMVGSAAASNAAEMQVIIDAVRGSTVMQEDTKNNAIANLMRQQRSLDTDNIKAQKEMKLGQDIVTGKARFDANDPEMVDAVNRTWETERQAIVARHNSDPTANPSQQEQSNQKAAGEIRQMTKAFLQNNGVLPNAAVADIGRKLGSYNDPAAINEGMSDLDVYVKSAPVVLSNLPKEMADDYKTFSMYKEAYGNDAGQAARKMIELKKMTTLQQTNAAEFMAEAQAKALAAVQSYSGRPSDMLAEGTISFGRSVPVFGALFDNTFGDVFRFFEEAGKGIKDPTVWSEERYLFEDQSAPDVDWIQERYQQEFVKQYTATRGEDETMVHRYALQQVQRQFGMTGLFSAGPMKGVTGGSRYDMMWMPPEKVLKMNNIKMPGITDRLTDFSDVKTGTFASYKPPKDFEVIKNAMAREIRYLKQPMREISGAAMKDEKGNVMYKDIDLWQQTGMEWDPSMQNIRLTTSPLDKQNKTPEDFAKNPVYGVQFKKDGIWHDFMSPDGRPLWIDFNNVINAVKEHDKKTAAEGK